MKLALWCEAHGLESQKLRHLAVAVLSDPSNAMARGLMGLVEYGGKWRRPEAVADAIKADPARADLLAEYAGRRVRTPVKPEPQWKLALWCEEKGLKDERGPTWRRSSGSTRIMRRRGGSSGTRRQATAG